MMIGNKKEAAGFKSRFNLLPFKKPIFLSYVNFQSWIPDETEKK